MTFGEKLQKLRAREGLSQDALAELLNVSRQAVSRWERDETMPETEKVIRISDHFHVTTDYLLKDGPEHFPQSSRPLPDPAELWRKYGFLLGWVIAAWGLTLCLRISPMAAFALTRSIANKGEWFLCIRLLFLWFSPGASFTAAGILLARRWQKAGYFRRQDLGWALALGGGLMLPADLLSVLADRATESYAIADSLHYDLWPVVALALGLLLALLPPRKRREAKIE